MTKKDKKEVMSRLSAAALAIDLGYWEYACLAIGNLTPCAVSVRDVFNKAMQCDSRRNGYDGWFGTPNKQINQERRVLALLFTREFVRTEL